MRAIIKTKHAHCKLGFIKMEMEMNNRIIMAIMMVVGLAVFPAMAVVDSAQTFGLWHMESLDPVACPKYGDTRTGVFDDDTVFLTRGNDLVLGQQRNPEDLTQRPTISTDGRVGNAMEFDGINDMARSSFVWPNTQDCEFEFDLYAEDQTTEARVVYITSSMLIYIRKESDGTRTLVFRVYEAGVPAGLAQSSKFNSETWVHVLARAVNGDITITVDGLPGLNTGTYTAIDPVHSALSSVWIGADHYAGSAFKGKIDELAIRDLNQQLPDYLTPHVDAPGTYVLFHCDEISATGPIKTPDDDSFQIGRDNDGLMLPVSWPPEAYPGAPLTNSFNAAFDQCFVFNGFNQAIRVGESSTDDLGVADSDVRIETFARLDQAKANDNSLYTVFYQPDRFAVFLTDRSVGDWRYDFAIWTELGLKSVIGVIANPEDWHHYAIEFAGGQLEAFIDGHSVGTVTDAGSELKPAIRQLHIGGNHSSTRWWKGLIDEFRISSLKTFTPYTAWLARYPGVGNETSKTDNPDNDRLDNLGEWAFGGNPDDAGDIGHVPTVGTIEDGGTNWMEYIYAKRKNAAAVGLEYYLELTTDLEAGSWTNDNYDVVGTGMLDGEFDAVTNRVPTDAEGKQFIKLMIESN